MSRLQWARHVETMTDDILQKRATEFREHAGQEETMEAKAEMGGLRYVKKAGEEEDWEKKTSDRGGWKRLHSKNKWGSEGPLKVLQFVPNTGPYLVLRGTPVEGASKDPHAMVL